MLWVGLIKDNIIGPFFFDSSVTGDVYPGANPGFWERGGLINIFTTGGGYGMGRAAFLLLRLFSMKFTVIFNTFPSRDIRITRACMDSDEKTLHSSQCYGSYCSAIKFVTQSFCEFVNL